MAMGIVVGGFGGGAFVFNQIQVRKELHSLTHYTLTHHARIRISVTWNQILDFV